MTTYQFSRATDAKLNVLEQALGREDNCPACEFPLGILKRREQAETEHTAAFADVFKAFDAATEEPGKPARFICDDGYTLARQVTDPDERMDEKLLQNSIEKALGAEAADALWKIITDSVTTRTLNQNKLVRAVKAGKVSAETLKAAMVKPKPVTSRHRRKATKEDMEILSVKGFTSMADFIAQRSA